MSGILVVGSINADIILKINRLPVPGETLSASNDSGIMVPGGKGANQAVAAANLGAPVSFSCKFGSDGHGATLRGVMAKHNVNVMLSETVENTPSGQAYILLQDGGQNSIVIVAAANDAWPAELVPCLLEGIASAGLILLQREVPDHVNLAVATAARAKGVPVVMDVGGRDEPLPPALLPQVSVLSPNETELARLLGVQDIGESDQEIEAAARRLQQSSGVGSLLVKLGSRGSMWVPAQDAVHAQLTALLPGSDTVVRQLAFKVDNVVDTTGAGDCFTGAFAVGALSRWPVSQAMRFASAAASICVQRLGAIPSLPFRQEVDELLAKQW